MIEVPSPKLVRVEQAFETGWPRLALSALMAGEGVPLLDGSIRCLGRSTSPSSVEQILCTKPRPAKLVGEKLIASVRAELVREHLLRRRASLDGDALVRAPLAGNASYVVSSLARSCDPFF